MVYAIKELANNYIHEFKRMGWRDILLQGISLAMIIGSALTVWKTLMLVSMSESPVVVVLSGSMEPGFMRGDILVLYNGGRGPLTGDVVVFKLQDRDIPIVHRVVRNHQRGDGAPTELLTKGDNNWGDDRSLYPHGQDWLGEQQVVGHAVGYIPYLGMVTILMNDYPMLKYGLIGVLGLLVLTTKD
ncbi:unnamed protein product [Pedinophyceae sp. YPF-701]|nr:unnamed protein product [Pedinophyceae sp. YPF-701]